MRSRLAKKSFRSGLTGYTKYFCTVMMITMVAIAWQGAKDQQQKLREPLAPVPNIKAYAEEFQEAGESAKLEDDTPQKQEIIAYVRQVFGKDAEKALKLLSCENHALNPKAVNKSNNVPADSEDRGLFQINNFHQKVDNKAFLFDYKINTQIAYNIFSRDGHSFKLWSCGRKLGI